MKMLMRKAFVILIFLVMNSIQYQYKTTFMSGGNINNERIVDIQISYIDSPLIQMHWCGSDDKVIVLTSKGTIYRSEDRGRQWSKMSEVFTRKALVALAADTDDRVGIVSNIVASSVDKNLVMFTGSESVSWVSQDCGQSISVVSTQDRQLKDFQWHSSEQQWILASSWKKCDQDDKDCVVYKELWLSTDSGMQWTQIGKYVHQYSWGSQSKNRIIASFVNTEKKKNQSINQWNMDASLYYSDDYFKTRTLMVQGASRFLLGNDYIFVALVQNTKTQEVQLQLSKNSIDEYKFNIIDADQQLQEHSYHVIDITDQQIFMIVNHIKPSSPMGTIYKSDSTGTRFTKSLENASKLDGGAEFHHVLGLDGIYIANIYSAEQSQIYTKQIIEQQEEGFVIDKKKGFKDDQLQKFKQTRITFDKGESWNQLIPPTYDSLGKLIKCDPKQCGLHLHLSHNTFGPLYTQSNSIGIIVATGSIGKYLSHRSDQVNTYMSRDGGLTWSEIRKGSHIYEISDHGGLILMASNQQSQNSLVYSWNEGQTWTPMDFTKIPIEIDNIITEPSNKSMGFLLYGVTDIQMNGVEQEQGIIVSIDMDDLHQRLCVGLEQPGTQDSDYELWTPSGKIIPDCLLGKKVTYIRRKQDAQCYNPDKLERIVSIEPCACTQDDYECDIGYEKNQDSYTCSPINQQEFINAEPPQECNYYFTISSGYRKIAGDICEGGLQHPSIKLGCPWSKNSISMVAIILSSIILSLYLYSQQKNKNIQKKLSNDDEMLPNKQINVYIYNKEFILKQPKNKTKKPHEESQDQQSSQKNKGLLNQFQSIQLEENLENGLGYSEFDPQLYDDQLI